MERNKEPDVEYNVSFSSSLVSINLHGRGKKYQLQLIWVTDMVTTDMGENKKYCVLILKKKNGSGHFWSSD